MKHPLDIGIVGTFSMIGLIALGCAQAHEIRPGLLEIEALTSEQDNTAHFHYCPVKLLNKFNCLGSAEFSEV